MCIRDSLLPLAEGRIKSPVHMKAGMEDYASLSECIRRLDTLCRDKPYGYQLGVKGELFSLLCLLAAKSLPIHGERPSKSREKMKLLLCLLYTSVHEIYNGRYREYIHKSRSV